MARRRGRARPGCPNGAQKSSHPRRPRHLRRWTGRHLSELLPRASCTRRERQAVEGDALEEFSGTALDPTKLTPCFDWNFGACTASFNTGKERYLPSQVRISDGTAKLVAEPLAPPYASSACYQGQCTYKAGLVSTARPRADNGSAYLFPFTYGYVESRMKFPGTAGFFTAFWMLPTNPNFTYNTEIDIVEILGGHPDTIFMTYHYNDRALSTHRTMACTTTVRARRETTPPTS